MCKVLGLGFFYYKIMSYFFIFFGLGLGPETDQGYQPIAPLCPLSSLENTKNGQRLGRNGSVELAFALSRIMPNVCWPNIWRRCMV